MHIKVVVDEETPPLMLEELDRGELFFQWNAGHHLYQVISTLSLDTRINAVDLANGIVKYLAPNTPVRRVTGRVTLEPVYGE